MEYTVIVYKRDKRTKKGERFIFKQDHIGIDLNTLEHIYRSAWHVRNGYRLEFYETYRTVKNLMTGMDVKERFDLPRSCSVASETYWSA